MSASSNVGRVGVFGASGSGKSCYVKNAIKSRQRVVIFDPLDEYCGAVKNVRRVATLEELRAKIRQRYANFKLAYVPVSGAEARALSALSKLLLLVQEPYKNGVAKAPKLSLVVEEMNLSFPTIGGADKCKGFAEICSRGRHFGIEVFGVSQRIAEVSTRFRGNCTETIILRQAGVRDIQAAHDLTGVSKAEIKNMQPLQAIAVRGAKIENVKIIPPK